MTEIQPESQSQSEIESQIAEFESCPCCSTRLPARLQTGRIVCSKCGWTDRPKVSATAASNSQVQNILFSDLKLPKSLATALSFKGQNLLPKILIGGLASGLLAMAGGYSYVTPYLTLNGIKNGIAALNPEQVNVYIDYSALREDLRPQIKAIWLKAYKSQPGVGGNPYAETISSQIMPAIDKILDTYVTPSGMSKILNSTPPGSVSQDQMLDFWRRHLELDRHLQVTSMGYEDLNQFQVTFDIKNTGGDQAGIKLLFRREGFTDWKLFSIKLPLS